MPGCTTAAVTAQVRVVWSWTTATRLPVGPCGGPSWISTPANTPGRSGTCRSAGAPTAARERNRVQPVRLPTANASAVAAQFVAERPRTGVTVTTTTSPQASANTAAGSHDPAFTDTKTGIRDRATTVSCHPDRPKKCPIRARE